MMFLTFLTSPISLIYLLLLKNLSFHFYLLLLQLLLSHTVALKVSPYIIHSVWPIPFLIYMLSLLKDLSLIFYSGKHMSYVWVILRSWYARKFTSNLLILCLVTCIASWHALTFRLYCKISLTVKIQFCSI